MNKRSVLDGMILIFNKASLSIIFPHLKKNKISLYERFIEEVAMN